MKNPRKKIIASLISILIIPCVFAERLAPKDVAPIVYNGVKYIAPHWGVGTNRAQNGVYMAAQDVKTEKLLWDLKIYTIEYDKNLEKDVQDIFITKMKRERDSLIIWNEADDKFIVNLKTKEVDPKNKIYKK